MIWQSGLKCQLSIHAIDSKQDQMRCVSSGWALAEVGVQRSVSDAPIRRLIVRSGDLRRLLVSWIISRRAVRADLCRSSVGSQPELDHFRAAIIFELLSSCLSAPSSTSAAFSHEISPE